MSVTFIFFFKKRINICTFVCLESERMKGKYNKMLTFVVQLKDIHGNLKNIFETFKATHFKTFISLLCIFWEILDNSLTPHFVSCLDKTERHLHLL